MIPPGGLASICAFWFDKRVIRVKQWAFIYNMGLHQEIDLATPLRLRTAFRFPLQSSLARREVMTGALWLS